MPDFSRISQIQDSVADFHNFIDMEVGVALVALTGGQVIQDLLDEWERQSLLFARLTYILRTLS